MSDVYALCTAIKTSNFKELNKRDGSVSIHHQNIRFLAVEMFKVFKDISPQVVKHVGYVTLTSTDLFLFDIESHT